MAIRWTIERTQSHTLQKRLLGPEPGNGQPCPPVDLRDVTSVTVTSTSDLTGDVVVSVPATIVDAVNGVIEFPVTPADTAVIGEQTVQYTTVAPGDTDIYPISGVDTLKIVAPTLPTPSTAPPTGDSDLTFSYDPDGVLISVAADPGGVTDFTYDSDSRLASINGPRCTTTLTYTGDQLTGISKS